MDLSALKRVGGWLMRYRPIRDHADVPALLREFSDTVREEIDYTLEAQNAETFLGNFRGNRKVRVPRVVRTHSTRRVLTLEDVFAIKITDYDAITAAGVDRGEVARRLLDTYPSQASRVLTKMERGELMVQSPQLGREVRALTRSVNRLTAGVIVAAFLIGGVMLFNAEDVLSGYIFFGLAALTLLWIVFPRFK